jgi:hypothetical protein
MLHKQSSLVNFKKTLKVDPCTFKTVRFWHFFLNLEILNETSEETFLNLTFLPSSKNSTYLIWYLFRLTFSVEISIAL